MPRAVPPHVPPKPSRKGAWLGLATVLAILAMAGAWFATHRPSAATVAYTGLRTVKVAAGPAVRIMRVSGSTAARNFASLTAPMMRGPDSGRSLVLISLAKSGSIVKKGEFIAQIDAQSIKDHVDDINSQVQQAESDIKKRKAEQAIEMENLRQSLRVAKSDLEKAKLDAGAADIRTDIDKEILRLGGKKRTQHSNPFQSIWPPPGRSKNPRFGSWNIHGTATRGIATGTGTTWNASPCMRRLGDWW
ncbi:MAG: efflux RND transporter periplasmic adaptor subunit [Acidobacteriota bacterium]|nr:efflux RND transporter periplasmic adaptor subunit [Acidobacteriota bacterium]